MAREEHLAALVAGRSFVLEGLGGNPARMSAQIEEARGYGFVVVTSLVWCHPTLNLQRNERRARSIPSCFLLQAFREVPPSWAATHSLADAWEVTCTNPGGCPFWAPKAS